MLHNRIETLAHNLINYSCALKKGEKVLIEVFDVNEGALTKQLIKKAFEVGAYPVVRLQNNQITRQLLLGTSKEHSSLLAKHIVPQMEEMDAYIGISGGNNVFEYANVPDEKLKMYSMFYSKPIHRDIRVEKTKWVILRYPTEGMAQLAGKSTEEFENFYFNVCNLDYSKMNEALEPLKQLMERTDKVKIITPTSNLEFSIKGMKAIKCAGHANIPDGEIYTAPIKNSVNGTICYNVPSTHSGIRHDNITFEFKDGRIINATSSNTKALQTVLDMDEGARFIGEFSFGVNPYIYEPMLDILFDEKITGSIHFTPGACYKDADNGNQSAVHWDLVQIHRPEYGGGEVYFDDVLIRKDGRFVLDSLKPLNPENLV
jgi:aminopeptidase